MATILKMNLNAANAHSDMGRNPNLYYFQRDSRGHGLTGRFLSNADFGDPPHRYEIEVEDTGPGWRVMTAGLAVVLTAWLLLH